MRLRLWRLMPTPSGDLVAVGVAGDGTAVASGDRLEGAWRAWLPPVLAWVAAALLLCAAAVVSGHDPLRASNWARWDSGYYEAIAHHGYSMHRCALGEGLNARARWCGNTAWFPGYPLLIAAISAIGVSIN